MRKQLNPAIRAQLLRGAFYVILLLAICLISLALGQRNSAKHETIPAATGALTDLYRQPGVPQKSDLPEVSLAPPHPRDEAQIPAVRSQLPTINGPAGAHSISIPPAPKTPSVVLYDQYNNL